jgi:hypothetical protein
MVGASKAPAPHTIKAETTFRSSSFMNIGASQAQSVVWFTFSSV